MKIKITEARPQNGEENDYVEFEKRRNIWRRGKQNIPKLVWRTEKKGWAGAGEAAAKCGSTHPDSSPFKCYSTVLVTEDGFPGLCELDTDRRLMEYSSCRRTRKAPQLSRVSRASGFLHNS